MNKEQAKFCGFTHKGYIYGIIRIYAKYYEGCEEPEIVAKNHFYEYLLDVFVFFDSLTGQTEYFKMELMEIDKEEGVHIFSTLVWTLILLVIAWITLKLR